jgi:hypothetical protein
MSAWRSTLERQAEREVRDIKIEVHDGSVKPRPA